MNSFLPHLATSILRILQNVQFRHLDPQDSHPVTGGATFANDPSPLFAISITAFENPMCQKSINIESFIHEAKPSSKRMHGTRDLSGRMRISQGKLEGDL